MNSSCSRSPSLWLPFLSIAVALSGCVTSDSSSLGLSEFAGAPVSVGESPLLTLGHADGDSLHVFHRVRHPFLLADDRVVVPVTGANTIRVFDLAGNHVISFGRPGPGPGEFTRLDQAWARGDTLEAYDSGTRTISRFLPDGRFESLRLENPDTASRLNSPFSAVPGTFGEGWVMIAVPFAGFGVRDSVRVLHFGRDGQSTGVLVEVLGMKRFLSTVGSGPEPLSPRAVVALANGTLYAAETLNSHIEVLNRSGGRHSISWTSAGTQDPNGNWEAVRDSLIASAPPEQRATVVERYRNLAAPEQISTFWDIVPDQGGFLWVSPYDPRTHIFAPFAPESAGGVWSIFSQEGERIAEVAVPAGLQPTYIGDRYLVGIHRDDLGIETVRVHELVRR